MRYSELLIPTLKEAPSDAEVVSHKLMLRAGYIRKLAAGVYSYLPLCVRVLRKIENIIRDEMNQACAHELLLPIVMPAELWIETGRWQVYGKELLRFKDRHERDFCIGPTHEEAITDLVRREVRSYRDLPKNLFQIQTKFRDEVRPRFGLMRGREFIMKDGYSFDRDESSALATYQKMYDAYQRIFTRCGLAFRAVEAMTGSIGGSQSHEFQVLAASGEDEIISCTSCDYAANSEKAELKPGTRDQGPGIRDQGPGIRDQGPGIRDHGPGIRKGEYKKVSTPGKRSVEEVCEFLKVAPHEIVKTLIFETDKGPFAGLVRGDHALKEAKFKEAIGAQWCNLAEEKLVNEVTGAPAGFSGPIGLTVPVIADHAVAAMTSFVVGANETDVHYVGVNIADFTIERIADIRRAVAGDPCPRCGAELSEHRGIEVGQVFYLGTKYSVSMNAVYLDENGHEQPMVMGCYGIGVGRTAAAAIEQHHDDRGIVWPLPIAPFAVEIVPLGVVGDVMEAAECVYRDLRSHGVEVLIDDRDERPGVKFADADLIGIPYRVVIGAKGLAEGKAEIKHRRTGDVEKVAVGQVVGHLLGGVLKDLG